MTLVSADLNQDEKSGTPYYMIRTSLPDDQVARLGAIRLLPGMPVETFIETPVAPFARDVVELLSPAFI